MKAESCVCTRPIGAVRVFVLPGCLGLDVWPFQITRCHKLQVTESSQAE